MESEFTEFSYGFALTRELVDTDPASIFSAPVFPSLSQEGQPGGGYDLQLDFGFFLFLQFKQAEYMIGGQAGEVDLLGLPYYRFGLMPRYRSLQHQMLLELENYGELVFYAAPRFYLQEAFNTAFANSSIIASSIFVQPAAIGPVDDDDQHYVVYNDAETSFQSEIRKIKSAGREVIIHAATGSSRQAEPVTKVAQKLREIVQRHREKDASEILLSPRERSISQDLRDISFIAHAFFHCEVIFSPQKKSL